MGIDLNQIAADFFDTPAVRAKFTPLEDQMAALIARVDQLQATLAIINANMKRAFETLLESVTK